MGKKQLLDKFYTKKNVAKYFIEKIDLKKYHTIIDPCAGDGAFSEQIEGCLAFDILPENKSIIKLDFFDFKDATNPPVLTISNIPFGVQSNLAIAFFKKAATYSDTIAFILPKSFKKESVQNKLPLNFHLCFEEDVPKNSFILEGKDYDVPCVFQVWEKKEIDRKISKLPETNLFSFCKKENANVSIRRVGVYSGKAFYSTNKSSQSHYFLNTKIENFVDVVNKIEWEHNNTVGPRSLSKKEFIDKINKVFS